MKLRDLLPSFVLAKRLDVLERAIAQKEAELARSREDARCERKRYEAARGAYETTLGELHDAREDDRLAHEDIGQKSSVIGALRVRLFDTRRALRCVLELGRINAGHWLVNVHQDCPTLERARKLVNSQDRIYSAPSEQGADADVH
jgi:hypothetical protein